MKRKRRLIPELALNGIRKNTSAYLPYIGISVFAVFTYFVFDLILNNKVVMTVPKAAYAMILMRIGFGLLGMIMIPFLYYTNSFLIKRRKKELGLYSMLGLEKKHIGLLMFCETGIIYVIVVSCAIGLGLLFSKLLFLLLLNLIKLPVDTSFSISGKAILDALMFYAGISVLNLFVNLVQVGKAKPVELMGESKKGEKEPKHIFIWSLFGLIFTGMGYSIAIKAKIDSMIFIYFFMAILFVVAGTYFLFTSGSILLLRGMKKNKKYYYRPDNFIMVSGMFYRMKKNAAGLANICIFATMSIITVVCTISMYLGLPSIQKFMYPYDVELGFLNTGGIEDKVLTEELEALAKQNGVELTDYISYRLIEFSAGKDGNSFQPDDAVLSYEEQYKIHMMTLEEYNRLENKSCELEQNQVLIYSTGADFGYGEVVFGNSENYQVIEELRKSVIEPKAVGNNFGESYYIVVKDEPTLDKLSGIYGRNAAENMLYKKAFQIAGGEKQRLAFAEQAVNREGLVFYRNGVENYKDLEAAYGALIFIGISFGTIFLLCLLVIMYYKQVTEGFEDQKNFEIMQQVGMSDQEVRHTIKKQILLVFFLPLVGAVIHTAVGMNMVLKLMASVSLHETGMIIASTVSVCAVFAILYVLCYNLTAKTYYRIVKKMA